MTRTMVGPLLLALGLLALPARAEPDTYTVDAEETELVAFLFKAGVAARMGHDHVIAAEDVSGTITYDPDDPGGIAVVVSARAASLVADTPELLERHGVDGPTSPEDREEIEQTMRGESQLHVVRYPEIRFEGMELEEGSDGETYLTGEFTLRGVTRAVRFPVEIELDGDTLHGRGRFEIDQSDYGYEPYSAFLGAIRVEDEARIEVDLVAVREDDDAPPAGK